MPEGRGFLGRTLRTGQGCPAVTVLPVRWSLGYRLRSTGVDFRRPYGMQAVYHPARRGAIHPQPSRAGLLAENDKALNDALRVGLVQRNVALVATPPRKRQRTMEVFSSEQARILLEAVRGDRLEALYVVAITCGMRQGELLALRWRDADLDAGHVQVRSSVRKRPGRFIFTDPKTEHGRRKVALTALAIQALLQHRARQQLEQLAAGPAWSDGDLVFCNELGQPLIGINVTRHQYIPILKRAGLPLIRFHDLRHTAATLLLLQGVHPKIVSEILGHASITITLDLYSHVLPAMQKDATAAMAHPPGS